MQRLVSYASPAQRAKLEGVLNGVPTAMKYLEKLLLFTSAITEYVLGAGDVVSRINATDLEARTLSRIWKLLDF